STPQYRYTLLTYTTLFRSDPLKNTTSISLEPNIYVPLIKKLKEKNDYVVVNVDWGITDERSVTTRQKQYAHSLVDAGAYCFCLRSEEHTSELQSRFDLVCR